MKRIICFLLITLSIAGYTFAQNALGIFSGTVLDGVNNNEPLIGATVVVKNESTGFNTGTTTDIDGKFRLEELPLGGPYTITISYIGYTDKVYKNYQLNMSDHIVIPDIILNENSQLLQEVVVNGFSYKSSRERVGSSTKIDSNVMNKLPSASRNFQSFAELSPLTKGMTVAGAKGNMMGMMLDGASNRIPMFGGTGEGAFPISMEAIREFEVVTNTYGVVDGRGGAGAIKAVTKSGSNDFHASAWGYYTGGNLSGVTVVKDDDEYKRGEKGENTISQFGATFSGPIIKDKLHFFLTYDRYVETKPWRLWDFETAGVSLEDAENNLGITKQNMDLITNTLMDKYGVPRVQQYGSMSVDNTTDNFLIRLDWSINPIHSLMARYSYHRYTQPNKAPDGGLFSTQYKGDSRDHNLLLNLKSRFNPTLRNDLKFSLSTLHRTGNNVYPRVPVGVIKVTSDLPNGQEKQTNVVFGNQYWAPETISSTSFQLIDNLTHVSGNIKYLFGADLQLNLIHDLLTHNQQGEFVYYSLDNFLNNSPDEFNRKVPMTSQAGDFVSPAIFTGGLYAEASMTPIENLDITLGLRWDATYLPVKPKADPLLEAELGLHSDVAPFDWKGFQPRIFAMWDIQGKGTDIMKFGAGLFKSEFTTQALSFALINNAGNFKSVSARKTDGNMPECNWPSYYEDFANVPGYDNWLKTSDINVDNIPDAVHLIDKDLKAPTTFKTNLTYTKYLTDKWMITGGVYFNLTWNSYMLENKNLKDLPEFYVKDEGNRGVYVPVDKINSNGLADYTYARKSERFNEVMMFTNSDWFNKSWNVVIESAYKILDGEVRASYTYGQSKGGVEYNSGNPRDKFYTGSSYYSFKDEMGNCYDSDDMRHKVVLTFISPSWKGFTLGINAMAYQWDRFSSFVNTDQNGDKTGNSDNKDLSFIFDPDNCPTEIKEDLEYVYQHTSSEYRDFLEANKGGFAQFNSGLQPWRFKLDLSLMKTFKFAKKHSIEARVDFFNILNLLNYKWGGYSYISNTDLYQIKGFDKSTQKYQYVINKEAGQKRYQVSSDELFRVQFGVKYNF